MAETVYKKISELTSASIPLAGTEYIEVSATGASKKALFSGIFGVGWWAKLMASFSAFKAPDADHADDADTLEGESASDLHDATQLVGAIPLANIPDELTGKNAATATSVSTLGGIPAEDVVGKVRGFIYVGSSFLCNQPGGVGEDYSTIKFFACTGSGNVRAPTEAGNYKVICTGSVNAYIASVAAGTVITGMPLSSGQCVCVYCEKIS